MISSRWACCCLLGLYDDLVIVPAANATPSRPPCYTSWHSRSTHGGYGLAVRGRVLAGSTDAELSRVRNSPIDITGLDANQQNVIRTYLSNQENAKAFAEMAKEMAMQSHNTQNSGKIMDSITAAKNADTISQDEAKSLVKDHLQQQIDDGAGKRTQAEAASQAAATPLSQAAVTAAAQGKDITASRLDSSGNSESVTIHGSTTSSTVLAEASGTVPHLRQSPNRQSDCWAVAAAILISWNKQQPVSVEDAVGAAGEEHRQLYLTNTGLPTASKDDFVLRSQMTAEPPASYRLEQYIDWLKTYGPLWVTRDSGEGDLFSPHAWVLIRISGTGTPDGVGTDLTTDHAKHDTISPSPEPADLSSFNRLLGARDAIKASTSLLNMWHARTAWAAPNGPKQFLEGTVFKIAATATPADTIVDEPPQVP